MRGEGEGGSMLLRDDVTLRECDGSRTLLSWLIRFLRDGQADQSALINTVAKYHR